MFDAQEALQNVSHDGSAVQKSRGVLLDSSEDGDDDDDDEEDTNELMGRFTGGGVRGTA